MDKTPYEIERKFLIRCPDIEGLTASAEPSQITQTYLLGAEGCTERVRSRTAAGRTVYTHTVKQRLSAVRRIEIEHEIPREEYEALLQRADPEARTIEKTRWCLRENGFLYEIDVFPFWEDRAFLEVELTDESQPFPWPEQIALIREVTDDRRYTNAALAREIPQEELPKRG